MRGRHSSILFLLAILFLAVEGHTLSEVTGSSEVSTASESPEISYTTSSQTQIVSSWFHGEYHEASESESEIQLGEDSTEVKASTILKTGMVVTLKGGKEGLYCSAGADGCVCDSQVASRAETFLVTTNGDGHISLCVQPRGESKTCGATPPESVLEVEDLGNSIVSMKNRGKFCSDSTPVVSCKADSVGKAEKFTVECIKNCPPGVMRHKASSSTGCTSEFLHTPISSYGFLPLTV